MDEISTGLDSSTTFQIVKCMQQIAHLTETTILMSLLQPDPETFNLFDDVILLSEGQIIYQGPREHVLEFFESCGFECPERKGTADFLQEVTTEMQYMATWKIHLAALNITRSDNYNQISLYYEVEVTGWSIGLFWIISTNTYHNHLLLATWLHCCTM